MGKNDRIGKRKEKAPVKERCEIPAIISLMPILGVNNYQHILHMPKRMVYCYTTGGNMNQFTTGYMINPSPKFNNAFRTKVGKLLGVSSSATKNSLLEIFC